MYKHIIAIMQNNHTLIFDNNFIPLSTPVNADVKKTTVTIIIIIVTTVLFCGMPYNLFNPALICIAPSPKDVDTPAIVAITAKMSTNLPNFPLAVSSPKIGIKIGLINPFFFFLYQKYDKAKAKTA